MDRGTSPAVGGGRPGSDGGADRELELLALQLPPVTLDDPDRDAVVALRTAILELVTEISMGLAHPGCSDKARSVAAVGPGPASGMGRAGHHPQPVPGRVLDQDGHDVAGGVGVEMPVRVPHHPGHQVGVQVGELTRESLRDMINRGTLGFGGHYPSACRTGASRSITQLMHNPRPLDGL